ncbi:MAG: hypothetical protein JO180_07990 [Gemmatirosa sp.]|nr:hypothetical protein [Gemmatirosa sp.]
MPHPSALSRFGLAAALAAAGRPVAAQHVHAPDDSTHRAHAAVGAQAVVGGTRLTNALDGRTRSEGYVSQPALMGHAALADGHVSVVGTLNLEGLTMRRGELLGGVYGEGYVDRRHPHTLLHEAMAAVQGAHAGVAASLAAGKGFVPFGTDDPMMRPFERYPVNHHLAQILERAVAIAALRVPHALVEAATFNGDEPAGPWAWPRWSRFGDSWATRLTVDARRLELAASAANVRQPENPDGGGLDQRKVSAAARWTSGASLGMPGGSGTYALVEWARTDWMRGGRRVRQPGYRAASVLAEGGVRRRGVEVVARAERTGRQEEERLVDPFRAVRPAPDVSILGLTEWRVLTLGVAVPRAVGHGAATLRVSPFVEASVLSPRAVVRPAVFDPASFYGASRLTALTAGVRLGAGMRHERMGRYGVAEPPHAPSRAMPPMVGMP